MEPTATATDAQQTKPGERSEDVMIRTHLGTGNRKNPVKLLSGLQNQSLEFSEGAFDANCVLYIRNCVGCNFKVNVHSAKVMIEGCSDCKIDLHGKVITNTAEIWKCHRVDVSSHVKLALQLDISSDVSLCYERSVDMVQLVWAGVERMSLSFTDNTHSTLHSGVAEAKALHNGDVNDQLDQFIVRVIDGKLLQERIVRLPNGFPTTDREADAWDAEQRKKEEHLEQMARQLARDNPQLVAGLKKKAEPKVKQAKPKPNEPCHCSSGKKYKKCCQQKDQKEKEDAKKPERRQNLEEK